MPAVLEVPETTAAGTLRNIHGTALLIGDFGILIVGDSGAGKTTLALALVQEFAGQGAFARLVADDQLLVSSYGARLVCRAPASIAGLAEFAGIGPQPIAFEPDAVIDLCIELVQVETERFQMESEILIDGCTIPRIITPARNIPAASQIIRCALQRHIEQKGGDEA